MLRLTLVRPHLTFAYGIPSGNIKQTRLKRTRDEQQDLYDEIMTGILECIANTAFAVLRNIKGRKENSSSSISPSSQQRYGFTSFILQPAVATFDKKPLDEYKKPYAFFFPRTINDWNLIPSMIRAESYSNFCNYLCYNS